MYSFHTDNESWTFRFDYAPKLNKELDGRLEEMLLQAKAWKGPKQGLFRGYADSHAVGPFGPLFVPSGKGRIAELNASYDTQNEPDAILYRLLHLYRGVA